MATEVKLPRLGQGMESGVIVRWLKAEGDTVTKGEPLYELDTDKVTQEVEAERRRDLLKIVVPEGEVEVGATVAVIGEDGKRPPSGRRRHRPNGGAGRRRAPKLPRPSTPRPRNHEQARPRSATPRAAQPAGRAAAPPGEARAVKASPLARRIARERGVDLTAMTGTGPEAASSRRTSSSAPPRAAQPAAPAASALAPPAEVEVVQLDLGPQDDRAAADRGLGGARLPARRLART